LTYFSVCEIKLYLLFRVSKLGKKKKKTKERNEILGEGERERHDGLEGTLKAGIEGFPKLEVSRNKVRTKTSKSYVDNFG